MLCLFCYPGKRTDSISLLIFVPKIQASICKTHLMNTPKEPTEKVIMGAKHDWAKINTQFQGQQRTLTPP